MASQKNWSGWKRCSTPRSPRRGASPPTCGRSCSTIWDSYRPSNGWWRISGSARASDFTLDNTHSTAVFRIVQESLANIVKHAKASRAEVAIEQNGGEVTISVRDNGHGFSPQDPRKPNSFGLVGLRERVYLLGGEAAIISAPGGGTNIEVRLPLTSQLTEQ